MKIAILSCFYPFRGGIAQFNANLLSELGKEHEVRAFNFTRQYPSFLFPGKTQYVTAEDEAVPVESMALLDTANPFTWRKTAREIAKWQPDVLIMRYWMSYFAPSMGSVSRKMPEGCVRIGILDNVVPHEPHFFDAPLTRWYLKSLDGAVTLCDEVAQDLMALRKDIPHTTIPHPTYTHFGEAISKSEAEDLLGIPHVEGSRTLLFFGLIREYKGLDVLIRAMRLLDPRYRLIIAGEPYGSFEKYDELISESGDSSRFFIYPQYIRDSEVKKYFCAADLTVLPYKSATQSGISAVSNHFEIPMVVTDVGGLKETIGDRGTGIVCKECTPECVAEAIENYFDHPERKEEFVSNIRKENERLSWNRFCKNLTEFINTLNAK